MEERLVLTQEVVGSNPTGPAKLLFYADVVEWSKAGDCKSFVS